MPLTLPAPLVQRLWAHVRAELPRECVGLLGGAEDLAITLYPLRNVAPDPRRAYQADPVELLRALKAVRAEGLGLVGIYHSHPRGPARPSPDDRRLAAYPVPYLIADPVGRELRAYRLPELAEVPLIVVEAG